MKEVGCRSHATLISSSEARGPSPLIGIDHVGISSDFDHGGGVTDRMGADETLNVTAELLRRGYGDADVAKLWGANIMRVWRTSSIWGAAKDEPDHPR